MQSTWRLLNCSVYVNTLFLSNRRGSYIFKYVYVVQVRLFILQLYDFEY